MFGFGPWELLIILVIAMLIFGAGRLPQVGSALWKSIWNFKKGITEDTKVENEKTPKIEAAK